MPTTTLSQIGQRPSCGFGGAAAFAATGFGAGAAGLGDAGCMAAGDWAVIASAGITAFGASFAVGCTFGAPACLARSLKRTTLTPNCIASPSMSTIGPVIGAPLSIVPVRDWLSSSK